MSSSPDHECQWSSFFQLNDTTCLPVRIVFQNVFADIDANNIIALCSCLVFDEKSEDPITNNMELMKAFETCKGIARNVAEIMVGDLSWPQG